MVYSIIRTISDDLDPSDLDFLRHVFSIDNKKSMWNKNLEQNSEVELEEAIILGDNSYYIKNASKKTGTKEKGVHSFNEKHFRKFQ